MGNKISIIGLFWYGVDDCGGGVLKTRNYEKMLVEKYGKNAILCSDRSQAKKFPIKYVLNLLNIVVSSKTIICMFPTERMLKTFSPFLVKFKKVFGYKLAYVVLGGWLPDVIQENEKLRGTMKFFDAIYVETTAMKMKLSSKLNNVFLMPNYSLRTPLRKTTEIDRQEDDAFHFCIYSRIIKEKGIEEAITAIENINHKYGYKIVKLDIYGKIYDEYEERFREVLGKASDAICYVKMLKGDEAIQTLATYYALLFPTYYEGEGFPGTIVEAYMASLPVIASHWKYNSELVENGKTGLIFNLGGNQLEEAIEWAIDHPKEMNQMRVNCLQKSVSYTPEKVMRDLYELIER